MIFWLSNAGIALGIMACVYLSFRIYYQILCEAAGGPAESAWVLAAFFAIIPLFWVIMLPIGALRVLWRLTHRSEIRGKA